MFNNNKTKLTEDKVRKIIKDELNGVLKHYIEVNDVKKLVNDAVEKRKKDYEDTWRTRRNTREEVMHTINNNVDAIVTSELEKIVTKQSKMIEDKLLVELARKAMSLEVKE